MKKIMTFLLGILLFESASCAQQVCCDMGFAVYADYLYWKVCSTDLSFTDNSNEVFYNNPNYDSGWRVGGRIQKCRWDLSARYTSYNTTKNVSPSEGNFVDNTRVHYDTDWDIVDIEAGYNLDCDCDWAHLRPFAGAKLAWIDNEFEISAPPSLDRTNIHFKGYGLYTGLEGRFLLFNARICNQCIPIHLFGRGSIAVLDSTFNQTNLLSDGSTEEVRNFHDQCVFTPVLEAFAGLDIGGSNYFCLKPHILVGYEVQSWWGRRFNDANGTALTGIGGLVARLTLDY